MLVGDASSQDDAQSRVKPKDLGDYDARPHTVFAPTDGAAVMLALDQVKQLTVQVLERLDQKDASDDTDADAYGAAIRSIMNSPSGKAWQPIAWALVGLLDLANYDQFSLRRHEYRQRVAALLTELGDALMGRWEDEHKPKP